MSAKEDKKKLIGEYLKAADRFIQASEFAEAAAEVKRALALEPGNTYALAYNQRIKAALESQRKKDDAARVKKIVEAAKTQSASQPSSRKEPPPPPPPPPTTQEAAPSSSSPRQRTRAEREQPPASASSSPSAPSPASSQAGTAIDAVTRESLMRDVVSYLLLADTMSAEANDVMELIRSRLGFDDEEFVELQTSVKFELYRTALEKAWREGFITPKHSERLAELRKKIGLSADDQFAIEAEVRKAKNRR